MSYHITWVYKYELFYTEHYYTLTMYVSPFFSCIQNFWPSQYHKWLLVVEAGMFECQSVL